MPVIPLVLALTLDLLLSELLQALRCTVAVVCLAFLYKLLGIFLIYIESFRLDVWAIRASDDRAFIPLDSKPVESLIEVIKGLVAIALPVSILDS